MHQRALRVRLGRRILANFERSIKVSDAQKDAFVEQLVLLNQVSRQRANADDHHGAQRPQIHFCYGSFVPQAAMEGIAAQIARPIATAKNWDDFSATPSPRRRWRQRQRQSSLTGRHELNLGNRRIPHADECEHTASDESDFKVLVSDENPGCDQRHEYSADRSANRNH